MSRLFGPMRQNGYVVRDIEAAMKHWIDVLQVGPWFYIDRVQTDWFRHRGQDSALELSIALANSGDLQIELIQQRNDAPSMYKEFLDSGREGLQHVAFWSTDYQSLYDRSLGLGYRLATKARSAARRAASPTSIPVRRPIPLPALSWRSPTSAATRAASSSTSGSVRGRGMGPIRFGVWAEYRWSFYLRRSRTFPRAMSCRSWG
jgi:hypothetical protein